MFARRPQPGRVKTRLSPPLPPEAAAALYEASLRDVLALAARERGQVEICYDAAGSARAAEAWFAEQFPLVPLSRQSSGDLGARLESAFARSFGEGAERVVVLGSDVPTLPESALSAAFDHLREDEGGEVVLGPAADGGYYLVGLRRAAWPAAAVLFRAIPWSGEEVLKLTGQRAASAGLAVRLLPGWYDIDRLEDLARARADAAPESHLGRWLDGPEGDRYIPRA